MNSPLDQLRTFWDERYAAEGFAYGTAPNSFLVEQAAALHPGDEVLCLADGEGRNGVWLASRGARVTALDVSPVGLAKARQLAGQAGVTLHTEVADVTTADLGEARWALIASIFLHLPADKRRALHHRCLRALKPGGRLVYEVYGAGQAGRGTGGPKEPALLPTLAEVEADFAGVPGCTVRHRFQGVRAVHEGALHSGDGEVVQLVVERAAP